MTHPATDRKPLVQVFSSGGGTQSCAISALIIQGRLPKPDICVIADTGYENNRTWEYQDAIIVPALAKCGVEVFRVLASDWAAPWGNPAANRGFATSGQPMIPAYTDQSGMCVSKLSTYCSNAWKQEVVDRWLSKACGVTRSQCVKWIGFSRDEVKRVFRMAKGEEYLKGLIRFPLIQDVPTTRQEAIKIVEDMGWPTPPRSRCWMCPNQNDHEWREIKADPDMWDNATRFEDEFRLRDPHAYCHKSGKPLREVDFREEDDLFAGKCESGGCFL
jgi:hypothetical protein